MEQYLYSDKPPKYESSTQPILLNRKNSYNCCLLSAGLGPRTPGCGISDSVQSWMDEIRYSGEKTELPPPPPPAAIPPSTAQPQDDDADLGPQYKYSLEANDPSRSRVKRALPNPNSKKSCALYIQTDPLFWKHIREQVTANLESVRTVFVAF